MSALTDFRFLELIAMVDILFKAAGILDFFIGALAPFFQWVRESTVAWVQS